MTGTVVPIGGGPRRLPQAGRIRTGKKTGRGGRASVDNFIFTSQKRELLEPLAELYGGEITAWNEDKSGDRFKLESQAPEINVVLPPEPLTEAYELWTGNTGLVRRCDGYTATVTVNRADSAELEEIPCVCERKGTLECKYKLNLVVLIPEVESLGAWRLVTSSDNARKEIPAMVELIQSLQERGLTRAKLRIEKRTAPGKRFNVPVLDPGVSLDALGAGAARVQSLGSPVAQSFPRELPGGEGEAGDVSITQASPAPSPDDVIDAEVLDEPDPTIGRAWLDNLPAKDKAAALVRAREIAEEDGRPLPTNAAAIDDQTLHVLLLEMTPYD